MLPIINDLLITVPAAGLSGLWTTLMDNYIQWIYLAAVAIFAIIFLKDRAWMKLLSFVGIAAIVGVLVFGGTALFGKNGSITGAATTVAGDIN